MNTRLALILILSICITLMIHPAQAQSDSGELLTRINTLRAELGLSPYRLNTPLTVAAQNHADWMVTTSQVTHVQDNGSSPRTRAQANGYNSDWVSENIYMGTLADVNSAWTFWLNSPIHYAGLTSANYRDIGIASAQGAGGQAFVLVFGVPSGTSTTASANGQGQSSDGNQASAPPIAIVGYDEVGNIRYELQAGDTLGQVLLLFGYTWDELNALLELNNLTDADITTLDVGQIVLVPPPQGTYTPTPQLEATEEVEEVEEVEALVTDTATTEITDPTNTEITDPTNTEITESPRQSATPTATINPQTNGVIPTPVPVMTDRPAEEIGVPVVYVAVSPSPTIDSPAMAVPTLQVNPTATIIPIVEDTTPARQSSNPPPWLIGAIILQLAVLGYAIYEFFRRKQ